jgi:hypothetical protein
MPIDAIGLHCYITGNGPPEWAKPEAMGVDGCRREMPSMRRFLKRTRCKTRRV